MREEVGASLVAFERTPGGFSARFRFAPDLPVFGGHFPGRPLVPGAFLIEAVRCAAERARGCALRISEVVEARFGEEVGPGRAISVDATLDGDACFARIGGRTRIRLTLLAD